MIAERVILRLFLHTAVVSFKFCFFVQFEYLLIVGIQAIRGVGVV